MLNFNKEIKMNEKPNFFNEGLKCIEKKSYNEAIILFNQDLEQTPNDSITHHKIGLAQTYLGVSQKDKSLLESAIQHFRKAIALVESDPGKTFPTANENLNWASEELRKLI